MSKGMFNLETLAGGGLSERVNSAIKEVMANIADPNTSWKNKRKITVEMVFEAKEDRDIAQIDIIAKTKLAPREGIHTKVLIDHNMDGEIIGSEFRKQLQGQVVLKVDNDTGEVLSNASSEAKTDLSGLEIVK